ncbi:MAG TPA: hypothetical protein PKN47_14130 [Nitrospira sp.]|nr:hypothetical protein [Nitrospira sp.]
MSLHPDFPSSPYEPLIPDQRWFPADEALRSTAYEKLLPPLVAKVREEVLVWRSNRYAGASATSAALLRHWFESDHLVENADGSLSPFRYYFAQREAVETVIWLFEVRRARDKYDLLRFDASGAVSSDGDLSTYTPDFIVRTIDGTVWVVETKGREELDLPQKMARLKLWCADATAAEENRRRYDFVFVDQLGFEKHTPGTFPSLPSSFTEYKHKS